MKSVSIQPTQNLSGKIKIPGDKSISHRAVMFSAISEGKSIINNLLLGEDVKATMQCFQALGVPIQVQGQQVIIEGQGLQGLKAPTQVLDCENSGTTLRLMMGILAGQSFASVLTGDASLNRRPMDRVMQPLVQMGAKIREERLSPTQRFIHIDPSPGLKAIHYISPIASAQVKSCLALAGLYAQGETVVEEPSLSRNHTEILFKAKGVDIESKGTKLKLRSSRLTPLNLTVPGDISSAAFFLVAGSIVAKAEIELEQIGVNPTRTGIIDVLKSMGAKVLVSPLPTQGGEAVATLVVRHSQLKPCHVKGRLVPRLIDEIPVLAVAAAKALGRSEFRDVGELRVKESDRIATLANELQKLGVTVTPKPEAFWVQGGGPLQGAHFHSHGDHRIAMSMAVAALIAQGPSCIDDVECVGTSYPEFWNHLSAIGVPVSLDS
ncbi:MAG: 3-phosphoshikimate 1-carboxyvinyltransferase [Deltaproteobacteria bacterium]|nr:3-phosphoshikimate 1-carboxyvinyltransferase [Deltaproteobacteria bacterium]